MLIRIPPEEGVFPTKKEGYENHYFALWVGGDRPWYIQLQKIPGHPLAIMHVNVIKNSAAAMRQALEDFDHLVEYAKGIGVRFLIAHQPLSLPTLSTWRKFVSRFQFTVEEEKDLAGVKSAFRMLEVSNG